MLDRSLIQKLKCKLRVIDDHYRLAHDSDGTDRTWAEAWWLAFVYAAFSTFALQLLFNALKGMKRQVDIFVGFTVEVFVLQPVVSF